MSRTFKDQPTRIRAKRLGRKSNHHDVYLARRTPRIEVIELVFYAHELTEESQMIAWAIEHGYTAEVIELTGYLAEGVRTSERFTRRGLSHLEYANRSIMRYPVKNQEHTLWPRVESNRSSRLFSTNAWSKELYEDAMRLHTKQNVFHAVTLTKVHPVPEFNTDDSYEIPYYMWNTSKGCNCHFCQVPDRAKSLHTLRTKMRNTIKELNSNTDQYAPEELAEMILD